MREVESAIARFQKYVDKDPSNAMLWIAFGDALHKAGLLDRAESAYANALELQPDGAIVPGRLAMVEISRQNFAAAEKILRRLIDEGAEDPILRFNLGLTLYYQRRFNEALALFETLANVAACSTEARYHLLSCLHNMNREAEAIARGEEFLGSAPSTRVRGYLALVHLDAQQMPQAYELARQTLKDQPTNSDAAAVLATHALENQEMEQADRLLQVVLAKEPHNVRAWQGLALSALHRSQHEVAIRHLQRAIDGDRSNLASYITLGWVYATRHDYENAERIFRAGIEVDGSEAELHGGLATTLVFKRQFEQAKKEVSVALRLNRQCFGAAFASSIMLKLAGKQEAATRIIEQLLSTSVRPDAPTPLQSLFKYWKQQDAGRPASQAEMPGSAP